MAEANYTLPADAQHLEERLKLERDGVESVEESNPFKGDGNDQTDFVAVDIERQNYAAETYKPFAAEGSDLRVQAEASAVDAFDAINDPEVFASKREESEGNDSGAEDTSSDKSSSDTSTSGSSSDSSTSASPATPPPSAIPPVSTSS